MIDRKRQILDAAAELLESRSFSSFSYQDLSARLGITKASIHHHFASKEALGVALTERYFLHYKSALDAIARKHADPWDQFEGFIGLMSDIQRSGNKICPPGVLQAEHNVIPKAMQKGVSHQYRFIQRWLSSMLKAGREQKVMDFPGTPGDQAALIHAAIQGALQNARAEGPKKFTAVVRQLREGMKPKR